jgi:chromosome segregation ATPase
LRRQIRFLQEKWNNDESSNTKTMESYQREMIESKERISILENESIQLRQRLEEKETALKDANKALKNLQIVLKDIAEDQRREKMQLETELREAKQELKVEKQNVI